MPRKVSRNKSKIYKDIKYRTTTKTGREVTKLYEAKGKGIFFLMLHLSINLSIISGSEAPLQEQPFNIQIDLKLNHYLFKFIYLLYDFDLIRIV